MPTTTAITQKQDAALAIAEEQITEALQLSRDAVNTVLSPIRRGIAQAKCLKLLRAALSTPEATEALMALQGSTLGFLTDKDKAGGYPAQTVIDCAIEAMARGVSMTGNEFNIISSRPYITKAGMKRLIGALGVKHAVTPLMPTANGDTVITPVELTWEYEGKGHCRRLDLPTRQNAGMGVEALQGKAIRKARAWLYETVTGLEVVDGDIESAMDHIAAPKKSILTQAAPTAALSSADGTNADPATVEKWEPLRLALASKGHNYTNEALNGIIDRLRLQNCPPDYMAEHVDWLIGKLTEEATA